MRSPDFDENKAISDNRESSTVLGLKKSIDVFTELETIQKIKEGRSLARFGDGELGICFGGASLPFQPYNPNLARLLASVLWDRNVLVGVPRIYSSLDHLNPDWANIAWWEQVANASSPRLEPRQYVSSFVTRPELVRDLMTQEYFDQISEIWADRDVAFVGNYRIVSQPGWKLRMATPGEIVSHPLLKNARSVCYVPAPEVDAFHIYSEIQDSCMAFPESTIIMLSLGPTATVLASTLHHYGYQALDLGQILMVYGFFSENLQPKYVSSEDWAKR